MLYLNNEFIGGVKFKVTCCKNDQTFADDDTVALDYRYITIYNFIFLIY